jgi:hypothetical protein
LFSHYFTYLFKKLHFVLIIGLRFFKILFRKRKKIELLKLEYNTEYIFENSLIVINYRFRNGICYQFGTHKTLEKQIKIFDLKNFDQEFELIVYGFFQKKTYYLKFDPQLKISNGNFKTSFTNLALSLKELNLPKLQHPQINTNSRKPCIKNAQVNVTTNPIIIKRNTYNQNEFI